MYRRHRQLFERFMEQRHQKLNNPENPAIVESLQFPIRPLSTALTILPSKSISNISSDSGVNSPHVLSLAMPVKPDTLHNRQP